MPGEMALLAWLVASGGRMIAAFALAMAGAAAAHESAAAARQGNGPERARASRASGDPQRGLRGPTAAAADAPAALQTLSRLQQLASASPQVAQLRRLQALAAGRSAPVAQLASGPEEEELVQGKFATAQPQPQLQQAPRANNTGLPDQLKSGIESLSGFSMDHVRVHYNSAQPAQLNALAYAQGSDIHLAPGQERHLPHEAWHVVQQAQGRVRPTLQMKDGVQVNDDVGLEREADVMGGRAAGGHYANPVVPAASDMGYRQLQSLISSRSSQLRQLFCAIVSKPEVKNVAKPRFFDIYKQSYNGVNIDWVGYATDAYELIYLVRNKCKNGEVAASSTDKGSVSSALDGFEKSLDNLVEKANSNVFKFDSRNEKSIIRETRSHSISRFSIANELFQDRKGISKLWTNLRKYVKLSDGSFNAIGRAMNLDVSVISKNLNSNTDHRLISSSAAAGLDVKVNATDPNAAKKDSKEKAKKIDNSFIENITISGTKLSSLFDLEKPQKSSVTASSELYMVSGEKYKKNDQKPPSKVLKFNPPLQQQQQAVIHRFYVVSRGPGQYSAMNATNARGYAWATNTMGHDSTDWEWLHIRGASLGGETNSKNLVLGTRDANTHMIPFESNLKSLAKIAFNNKNKFNGLDVTWTTSQPKQGTSHVVDSITIKWELKQKSASASASASAAQQSSPGDLKISGEATFRPLKTDTVLSKKEIELLSKALTDARTGLDNKVKEAGPSGKSNSKRKAGEEPTESAKNKRRKKR